MLYRVTAVLNKCLRYNFAIKAGSDEKIDEMNSQKLSESPRTLSLKNRTGGGRIEVLMLLRKYSTMQL